MPPKNKSKSRKAKGASATAPSKKQTKKATKHAQAYYPFEQDLWATDGEQADFTEDEAILTSQEAMAQKMDSMMAMQKSCHRMKFADERNA